MLYLSGSLPRNPDMRRALLDAGVGFMATPAPHAGWDAPHVALDNGCFSDRWSVDRWRSWLEQQSTTALFAVVPDVVGDAAATRVLWDEHAGFVRELGHRVAYVLQDGETVNHVPWDECDAVFIGGSTNWKLSEHARELVAEAKRRGKWVHMGRVNSLRRMRLARDWGCDSVDGTYLKFGPDINTPRLLAMLRDIADVPSLFMTPRP